MATVAGSLLECRMTGSAGLYHCDAGLIALRAMCNCDRAFTAGAAHNDLTLGRVDIPLSVLAAPVAHARAHRLSGSLLAAAQARRCVLLTYCTLPLPAWGLARCWMPDASAPHIGGHSHTMFTVYRLTLIHELAVQ